ncbi:amidohydrolase family protein [Pistricoccus aurantiacus]|uniref:amidohydrolase family protein n=1 Tax=Pistricoccus aurantiacus TaxID=1883414 RepID=UPI00363D54F1
METRGLGARVSYYLFTQTPEKELDAFRYWARNFDQGKNMADTANGYVLEGGGEFLTWNAGDFGNFTAPHPEALEKPHMRQELYEVTRFLAERDWPIRIHTTYDQTVSKILDIWKKVDAEHSFDDLRCIIDHVETISDQNIERVTRHDQDMHDKVCAYHAGDASPEVRHYLASNRTPRRRPAKPEAGGTKP